MLSKLANTTIHTIHKLPNLKYLPFSVVFPSEFLKKNENKNYKCRLPPKSHFLPLSLSSFSCCQAMQISVHIFFLLHSTLLHFQFNYIF